MLVAQRLDSGDREGEGDSAADVVAAVASAAVLLCESLQRRLRCWFRWPVESRIRCRGPATALQLELELVRGCDLGCLR